MSETSYKGLDACRHKWEISPMHGWSQTTGFDITFQVECKYCKTYEFVSGPVSEELWNKMSSLSNYTYTPKKKYYWKD